MSDTELLLEEYWIKYPFEEHLECPFCGEKDLTIHLQHGKRTPYAPYYFLKCVICRASSGAYAKQGAVFSHWQTRNGTRG